MSKLKTAYALNQKIVYPSQGVGKIIDIKEKAFKEQMLLYYVIYLEASDMTVMIPVERCDELGIRSIVNAKKAQETLDSLGDDFEPITNDWKLRYQMNLDLLKKGSVDDIATIVRCLYHRSKIKELPILERKLYDSAKKLLEDEISFALEKTTTDVYLGGIIGFNDLGTHSNISYTGSFPAHLTVTKDTNTERTGTVIIRRYVGNETDP